MKIIALSLLAALALPTSAEALTWKEFWEPFTEEEHVHHYHYRRRRPRTCQVMVHKKVWVSGYWASKHHYRDGYYERRTKLKWVPCRDKYPYERWEY